MASENTRILFETQESESRIRFQNAHNLYQVKPTDAKYHWTQLGNPIDLYQRDVKTMGVLVFPDVPVDGDQHTLGVEITGTNPSAVKSFMFGIDYLRVKRSLPLV